MNLGKNEETKYFYTAYGLNIHSDFQLSELIPAQSGGNVRIRLGKLNDSFLCAELNGAVTRVGDGITVRASAEAFSFHWRGIGKAFVRKGCDVIIEPETGIDESDLSPYISGSILAVLLHQRGRMVLHASAVVIGGLAIAFLGEKGAGKSTLAAFLQNRGYMLLTDDLVPVKFVADEVHAIPGFPRIRLWPDAVKSIGLDPQTLPRINSFINKLSHSCFDNFSNGPVRLDRIYVLVEDSEIGIEKLGPQESFIEITKNCYLSRYMDATGQTANHFRHCEALVASVPIFKLKRPHDFNLLSEVSLMVEDHW